MLKGLKTLMNAIISEVKPNSIAWEFELESGDKIIKVNDKEIPDLIDFNFETATNEYTLTVEKKETGEIEVLEIEKDDDEELGIVFESAVFDGVKRCLNKCIFCFVDQQPKHLRKTLYIKDDDYRLSYLQGTYVTLTNLKQEDKERIEKLNLGPLYVSVHTTNGELRKKMLNNKNADKILNELDWLKKASIPIHCQIVLCPGYNDNEELIKTLNDLYKYKKIVKSVAIVPVGITKYRENDDLKKVDYNVAKRTIEIVNDFNLTKKTNFAQLSDEFFILTNSDIPDKKYYKHYAQLDDGVGTTRIILDDFFKREKKLPKKIKDKKKFHFILSKSSQKAFDIIVERLNQIGNLNVVKVVVESKFFGDDINVSGLIVGSDILLALKNQQNLNIVLPSIMLKPYTTSFLDDITVEDLEKKLNSKIHIVEDSYSVSEIIELCCG